MAEFNQSTAVVERARAYLADIEAGHVSFADESAPFLTLTGYLGAVLDVIDGTGSTRAVRVALLRCDFPEELRSTIWMLCWVQMVSARSSNATRSLWWLGTSVAMS